MAQYGVIGKLLGANMNTTADQAIPLIYGHCVIDKISVSNASGAALSLAVGGFYTGAAKSGTIIVAATQVYSGVTSAGLAISPVIALPVRVTAAGQIYFALTTAQGSAAAVDIYVLGIAADQ